MIEVLLTPFKIFVAAPLRALLLPATFAVIWLLGRTRAAAVAALLWCDCAIWDISVMFRPVRKWIRVDLLLIAPVLTAVAVWGLLSVIHSRTQPEGGPT